MFRSYSFLFIILCFCMFESWAAKNTYRPTHSALVVDFATNKVLYHENANVRVNPASLTKMMTIYIAFEQIAKGKISMHQKLKISKKAASQPRSNIGLKQGTTITLKEAILSLIVRSANDSAVVIAEAISNNEESFAKLMNQRAKQLGMKGTYFTNASGWHHKRQKTTAIDMAKLALALKRDYGQFYHLFSRTSFYYKNRLFKGHNHVLTQLKGAEGMKTGYTSNAGWNLVTTAKQGKTRLVGVIIGGASWQSRDKKMVQLMNAHFKKLNNQNVKAYTKTVNKITKKTA